MSGKRRVLFISHVYPNGHAKNAAIFNHLMVRSMARISEVDVLAPLPWVRRKLARSVPFEERLDGIRILHPVYYYLPGVLRFSQGHAYLLSIQETVKKLMRNHHYDTIWSSWLFPDGWAAARLALRYRKPCFLHVIGTDVNRLGRGTSVTRMSMKAIADSTGTVCVSRALRDKLVFLGAEQLKLSILYNGVDRSIFHPQEKTGTRKALGIDPRWKIILFVGNIIREKGVKELARAFSKLCAEAKHADYRLVMIGSGPCQKEIEAEAQSLSVNQYLIFTGRLSHERVAQWMNAADVFCLPSHSEGLPNVICEALCCHVPVVATRVGGIPELLEGSSLLFLVEPGSSDSLAAMLQKVLERVSGAIRIPHFLTWDEHARELLGLFGPCLSDDHVAT